MRGAGSLPNGSNIGMYENISPVPTAHDIERGELLGCWTRSQTGSAASVQPKERAVHGYGQSCMNKAPNIAGKAKEHSPTSHTIVNPIGLVFPDYLAPLATSLHAAYVRKPSLGRTARYTIFEWSVRRSARGLRSSRHLKIIAGCPMKRGVSVLQGLPEGSPELR
jgi:hypothetical protein